VSLEDDLERIADRARGFASVGEELAVVIPTEPVSGARVYLCAYAAADERSWLALDDVGEPVRDRTLLHDAVTVAALCELAEESAAGGDPDGLEAQLVELGQTEDVDVTDAREALADLRSVLLDPPRVASPAYLDRIGLATRRFEQELGEVGASPFAEAMRNGSAAVEGLAAEVEGAYRAPLA
jgi:hypothetical protein